MSSENKIKSRQSFPSSSQPPRISVDTLAIDEIRAYRARKTERQRYTGNFSAAEDCRHIQIQASANMALPQTTKRRHMCSVDKEIYKAEPPVEQGNKASIMWCCTSTSQAGHPLLQVSSRQNGHSGKARQGCRHKGHPAGTPGTTGAHSDNFHFQQAGSVVAVLLQLLWYVVSPGFSQQFHRQCMWRRTINNG